MKLIEHGNMKIGQILFLRILWFEDFRIIVESIFTWIRIRALIKRPIKRKQSIKRSQSRWEIIIHKSLTMMPYYQFYPYFQNPFYVMQNMTPFATFDYMTGLKQ